MINTKILEEILQLLNDKLAETDDKIEKVQLESEKAKIELEKEKIKNQQKKVELQEDHRKNLKSTHDEGLRDLDKIEGEVDKAVEDSEHGEELDEVEAIKEALNN